VVTTRKDQMTTAPVYTLHAMTVRLLLQLPNVRNVMIMNTPSLIQQVHLT